LELLLEVLFLLFEEFFAAFLLPEFFVVLDVLFFVELVESEVTL
jgi:hypothetical protein